MFYIKRNNNELGPYTAQQIQSAFQSGSILKRDLIRHDGTEQFITVLQFMEINKLKLVQSEEQLSDVFVNTFKLQKIFVNPFKYLSSGMKENAIIFVLLGIVLIPVFALFFDKIPFLSYTIYGLYFGCIWALILYKSIATDQVNNRNIALVVIGTLVFTFFVINIFHSTPIWDFFNKLLDSQSTIVVFLGMFFGVAIVEEFLKQFFAYMLLTRNKTVLLSRTLIFYGMIAGLTFGIYEGIEYQMTLNKTLEVDQNYFYNILRLTSLPFFHAIWAGIGAYFASLSFIEIKYKYSLRVVGLTIPALLHAMYNTCGLNVFGIAIIIISALLLTVYLTKSNLIGQEFKSI